MRLIQTSAFTLLLACAAHAQPGGAPQPPLIACGAPAGADAEILCGVRSPEDLELTPDGKTLLAAQFVRTPNAHADIMAFDLAAKKYSPVHVTNAPDKTWGDPACPGPIGDQLAGHGTSLAKRSNGAWQYFVVNHGGGRQSIEMYELKKNAGAWALIWHGCVVAEKEYNDVAALPDGGYIATHPTSMVPPATPGQPPVNLFDGKPSGWVSRWTPGKGETELPGTRWGYPNGVVVSRDGHFAYYAAWTAKEIHKYDLREGKDVTVTKLEFMPDNITWTQKGQLLAAGVKGARGNCGANPCSMGFGIAQLAPATMKVGKTFDSGDRLLISGVSVALQVGPSVYVGAFGGDRLVRLDWKQ